MKAIRNTETGWLEAWWNEQEETSLSPEAGESEEIITLDTTMEEFNASLENDRGEFAGAFVRDAEGANFIAAASEEPTPLDQVEIEIAEIEEKPLAVTSPLLAALLEIGEDQNDEAPVTYGDLRAAVEKLNDE